MTGLESKTKQKQRKNKEKRKQDDDKEEARSAPVGNRLRAQRRWGKED